MINGYKDILLMVTLNYRPWVAPVFWGQGIPPYSYYQCRAFDIAEVCTTFNVFSYDPVTDRAS